MGGYSQRNLWRVKMKLFGLHSDFLYNTKVYFRHHLDYTLTISIFFSISSFFVLYPFHPQPVKADAGPPESRFCSRFLPTWGIFPRAAVASNLLCGDQLGFFDCAKPFEALLESELKVDRPTDWVGVCRLTAAHHHACGMEVKLVL